mgnify:CR=1 FL=1
MITLNPYLGSDSITPYIQDCKDFEKGLFILAKTSNPNSGEIQDLMVDGKPIYEKVGELIEKWGEDLRGKYGYSSIGAVVGATHPDQAKVLREAMPHTSSLFQVMVHRVVRQKTLLYALKMVLVQS